MYIIDWILNREEFLDNPPVLLDVGASGAIHPKWKNIAKYSLCIAFDADDREMGFIVSKNSGYKKLYVYNKIVTDMPISKAEFYLTKSPYCSSLLKPIQESLNHWAFAGLFDVETKTTLETVTLSKVLQDIGVDKIDWFKTDSQGTDLRLFKSLGDERINKTLVAEFEPGIIDAYENEDKLWHLLSFMEGRPFWVSSMEIKGSHRLNRQNVTRLSGKLEKIFLKQSPGWAEVECFNTFEKDVACLNKRDFLLGWVFAIIEQQYGFAMEIATKGYKEFSDSVFNELENYALEFMTTGKEPVFVAPDSLHRTKNKETVYTCLFFNTYYQDFLDSFYIRNPGMSSKSYLEQKNKLQNEFFGDSNFYSEGLKKSGWLAEDLIVNCEKLQNLWSLENKFEGKGLAIAVEQIQRAKAQVVYIQNLHLATKEFLSQIRPYTELIVGQIAYPIPNGIDLKGFDIVFSSFPHFVDKFRKSGITTYYQPLAFEPGILKDLLAPSEYISRKYPVTFIGGISAEHGKGTTFLEQIASLIPVNFWGYGAETLPSGAAMLKNYHGLAWGRDMFSILQQSRIVLNRHIDVAENYANNMRLFEATGCGSLLITDYKDNLNELFEIGKEVVAYRSHEEGVALIKYYLTNPKEAEEIARAGQKRTLFDHNYTKRMEQTSEILERHLRYKREAKYFPQLDIANVSYGHQAIQPYEISDSMTNAWKSGSIPAKQRALVQQQLADMYRGKVVVPFQVLAECMRPYVYPGCSILEIGCASGYYYEVLQYLLNMKLSYIGADYSEPMISMAKNYYPYVDFRVADGARLPFRNKQFYLVISSCVLLHVPNYREHIAETARVAELYVIAHRTPVCRKKPTSYDKKYAYGVETVELRFNENEFIEAFASNKLELVDAMEYHWSNEQDEFEVSYIFRKKDNN